MPEMDDNELRKLFQHAGRPPMGTDLTDRIMARVAVTRMRAPITVQPLIGTTGWLLIGILFIGLFVWIGIASGTGTDSPSILDPIWQQVPRMENFQINIPTGPWIIWAATAAGCLLLFTLLDRFLEKALK